MSNWVVSELERCERFSSIEEVPCLDFYRSVFGNTSGYMRYGDDLQLPLTLSSGGTAGVGTWRSVALRDIEMAVDGRNDAYLSACTYFPKKVSPSSWASTNSKDTANELCAFVLDIDRTQADVLRNLVDYVWPAQAIPSPTYIVASGHGVHLWYVLDWPVKMLKRWRMELEHLQRFLGSTLSGNPCFLLVDDVFDEDSPYEPLETRLGRYDSHGLTQPYRVVGSMSKDESDVVSAWRIGGTWAIQDLAEYAGLTQPFNEEDFDISSSFSSIESKKQQVRRDASRTKAAAVKEKGRKGHNPVFYPWFVAEAKDRARFGDCYGSRYNVAMCLTLAARKDNMSPRQAKPVTRQRILDDLRDLYVLWNNTAARTGAPRIEWTEITKAVKAGYGFRGDCFRIRWRWISAKCDWKIESHSKRNGLSQAEHLKNNREWTEFKHRNDLISWHKNAGRPKGSGTKAELVRSYASAHPDLNHSQIARALGISRPTVIKWLKE